MPRGRRPFPWIKLWFDMLNDVKMNRLSIAEKGCWVSLLLLAGQAPERGKLLLTDTEPMTIDDIASALHLTPEEKPALESCISKLVVLKSLRWNSRCLEVINFKKRQEVYKSDLPEGNLTNKLRINSELTPTEGEGRGERKRERKDISPLPNGKGVRKKRTISQTDPEVKGIFDEIHRVFGYPDKTDKDPIPNYGKEGQFIKKMLKRGFTRVEILNCWRGKVSQRGGEYISMVWVNEDIGKKGGQSGTHRRGSQKLPPRDEYTKPPPNPKLDKLVEQQRAANSGPGRDEPG